MKEVLKKIKPSGKERRRFNDITRDFLKKLNSSLKNATAILGGSGAKGTWLAGNHDVDIFVLFDYKKFRLKSGEISDILARVLGKCFKNVKRVHGSRDYFQMVYKKLEFEIVPILEIVKAEDAVNITDVSPLHAKWVSKQSEAMKDEILLSKQFFRANNLYGAESHIMGFSGWVLEILIVHYGSFQKLLEECSKWKGRDVVDVADYYNGKDVFFELNKSKLNSPIVVIDPVDKSRNAAAALSVEKFRLLKKLSKRYLKKPSLSYFEKDIVTLASLQKEAKWKKKHLAFIEVEPLAGKTDVVGVKLLKAFKLLERKLEQFGVAKSGWQWEDSCIFYFFTKKRELPGFTTVMGPPIKLNEFVKDFHKKHATTFVEKGRVIAKVKVKFPKLENFVEDILKDEYVKERVKKIVNVVVT